jgi:hypothetical protein
LSINSTILHREAHCHLPAPGADSTYSKLVVRFDYEPGEKDFIKALSVMRTGAVIEWRSWHSLSNSGFIGKVNGAKTEHPMRTGLE